MELLNELTRKDVYHQIFNQISFPQFVLSAVIISAAVTLIRIKARDVLEHVRSHSYLEVLVWVSTFLGILMLGVGYGLICGISTSLAFVVLRIAR